ncbi:MAG: radical SAM protein, partial [uncultured bacterium]
MQLESVIEKGVAGERIDDDEYLLLERAGDLYQLGFLADTIRHRKHPDNLVTYVIDRNINYTDICISACKFCAFFKAPEDGRGYLLSFPELQAKIEETKALGGTQILLQGGLHPGQPLEYYEEMVRFMKTTGIHVHGFSPPEICHFGDLSG